MKVTIQMMATLLDWLFILGDAAYAAFGHHHCEMMCCWLFALVDG